VNYTPHKADGVALKYDTHLDFYLSDSALECHRDHLRVDHFDVKVLTMKSRRPRRLRTCWRTCTRCRARSSRAWNGSACRTRRCVATFMRAEHFFNQKVSLVNYLSSQTKPRRSDR